MDAQDLRILRLVGLASGLTKADIARDAGLPRALVASHVNALIGSQVLEYDQNHLAVGRGRPAASYRIASRFGVVVAVDVSTDRTVVTLADLNRRTVAESIVTAPLTLGPDDLLGRILAEISALQSSRTDLASWPIRAMVIGLPGPIDQVKGRLIGPPIMPGWDDFPVAEALRSRLKCPVLVENDANLRALGESRSVPADQLPLVFLLIGEGIGAGIVTADGELHRGADGAAGDIGHIGVPGNDQTPCVCGKVGCVEAVASAAALARKVTEQLGPESDETNLDAFYEMVRSRQEFAVELVTSAAAMIGEVSATLVHVLNPRRIIVGGPLGDISDDLLVGVRRVVYERALRLATRELLISKSALAEDGGKIGAIALAVSLALTEQTS